MDQNPYSRIDPDDAPTRLTRRRFALLAASGAAALSLPGIKAAKADFVESGRVTIEQVQIAFIGSGNLGGGTLSYGGRNYGITVGGLGIGGFGISKMTAVGTVYNLFKVEDFAGAYVQARYGLAIGELSTGQLWLQNTHGVGLSLKADRTGLALSLGGDAVYIGFD
jgi:hypothetical protein